MGIVDGWVNFFKSCLFRIFRLTKLKEKLCLSGRIEDYENVAFQVYIIRFRVITAFIILQEYNYYIDPIFDSPPFKYIFEKKLL